MLAQRLGMHGKGNVSFLSAVLFVSVAMIGSYLGGNLNLAIYSLSFWHYYLYWLAYFLGAVSLDVFKRDAIAMKTVSLAALGWAYFAVPLNLASLAVVASGFLLNIVAARALGADRTYYGHEIAHLQRRQITAFPYSWVSHPMLLGNIAAFGGTLINADFRQRWWPLGCAHVAMNLGLLVMEVAIKPQHRRAHSLTAETGFVAGGCSTQTGCLTIAAGAVLGGAVGSWGTWSTATLLAAGMGGCVSAFAYALYCCYSRPASPAGGWRKAESEGSS